MKKALLLLILNLSIFANENKIDIYTENYPPYNMKIDNKLEGMAVDILKEILIEIGSKQSIDDINFTNWSRAYTIALKKKNSMVFSTTRTKERESKFKWVGPIVNIEVGIIALKNKSIKIDDPKELNKYRVGAVGKDVGEQLLIKNGVKKRNIQNINGENAINLSFKKMEKNRIDMFAYNTTVAFTNAKNSGLNPDKFEVIYVLNKNALYYAFNKQTDDDIIKKWQNALNKIKANNIFDKIIEKY